VSPTGIGDDLGARPRIGRADDDLRRRDVRELRNRKQEVADGSTASASTMMIAIDDAKIGR
jgi:hypothetical protein